MKSDELCYKFLLSTSGIFEVIIVILMTQICGAHKLEWNGMEIEMKLKLNDRLTFELTRWNGEVNHTIEWVVDKYL